MSNVEVKELRVKNGLTQASLAQIMGVSIQTIKNWESGKKIPSTALMKLKEVFHIDVEHTEEVNKENPQDNIGRLISIMEKDHQLIRDILEKKDDTIDRLLSIMEADRNISKEKSA